MTTTAVTKRSWLYTLGTGGKFALLGLAALLTLGPVVWTLITALSPTDSATQEVNVGFGAFADVFTKIPIWLYAWNSALVVLLVAAGQMLSAAMAGYVFAKFEFRHKRLMFALILATMMVPLQVTIVPVFMLVRGMGLADTLLALIVPALPTAFGTFLMRQYFMGIPTELGEAAQLDGAGPWRTFFGVYLPLATPGLAIVGILAFNYHWNEFFRPLIMTISDQNFTLPLGLVTLQGNLGTGSVSTVLAGVILSMIPALLVFFFGQKPLREGLTAGVGK
ncbi:sugar ABC transporter permease [Microbacterium sp. Leaf161]|uniref:carbohydrate ABC transporter permease n=1 Tax=Microbacterium sp. Leaf161 TaxID=1736281 RepID=UPI0006FC289E|nr:carbohydrate ABC transporter permease [Microbacterium sp. Leaf161]KQR48706.1 sugar ABC transporter permease [Microbacterium sp. Leaf161]